MEVEFEYNPHKSEVNFEKHGILLEAAQQLWGTLAVTIPARTIGEPRWMIIGYIDVTLYACIFTERLDKIRLISLRKASKKEGVIYHETIKKEN